MRWFATFICSSSTGMRLAKLLCSRTSRVNSSSLVSAAVGDKHADEGHGPGDEGGENSLHRSHPFHLDLFVRVSICTQPVMRLGCFASFGYRPMPPRPESKVSA